jgi:glycosyltransferase involved in cell wall biosynthesis
MRKRFIQSHFSLVDLFLAPSHFLLERYVDWGVPREKIRYIENGRSTIQSIVASEGERLRNRLGFFGQFSFYKGVHVLLRAMNLLAAGEDRAKTTSVTQRRAISRVPGHAGEVHSQLSDMHLWLHGANLELQPQAFQDEFNTLLDATRQNVTLFGRYEQAELPRLMANVDWVVVPSIWWENAPLVIQEAFQHRRPVICSDIGGMAEKVTDGVDGLHFRARDPVSLAETIRRAITTPGLWERLRNGIPEVYRIEDQAVALTQIYYSLLKHKTAQRRRSCR